MLIREILNKKPVEGTYGMEIEIEGANLPVPTRYWKRIEDGSLRANPDACEYILSKPLSFEDTEKALVHFNKKMEEAGTAPAWSYRCSTHVHVNVLEWDELEIIKVVAMYYAVEALINRLAGKGRQSNRFCLRLLDSYEVIDHAVWSLSPEGRYRLREDKAKYSALNLVPIFTQGSIEFRTMEGTTDTARIMEWLTVINTIITAAKKAPSVADIIYISAQDVRSLLKPWWNRLVYPTWEEDFRLCKSLSSSLIEVECAVKDKQLYRERIKEHQEAAAIPEPVWFGDEDDEEEHNEDEDEAPGPDVGDGENDHIRIQDFAELFEQRAVDLRQVINPIRPDEAPNINAILERINRRGQRVAN